MLVTTGYHVTDIFAPSFRALRKAYHSQTETTSKSKEYMLYFYREHRSLFRIKIKTMKS